MTSNQDSRFFSWSSCNYFSTLARKRGHVNCQSGTNRTNQMTARTLRIDRNLQRHRAFSWRQHGFYPLDAMLERVFATATCPSVRLSVRYSRYCIKTETASVMISSPSDSSMISLSGEVWLVEKLARDHPQRGRFVRVGWVRTGDFCDFSTYKPPYLGKGARYDQGYY